MNYLKQSTTTTIQLGPFLDDTDGKTPEEGLTIEDTDVFLSKAGAAFAVPNDTNNATHDRAGWYRKQLNITDTGTRGRLIVSVHESGALPVWREFMVLPTNVYDSLVAGIDNLEVDMKLISGDATAADNLELDYDGTGYTKANSTIGTTTTNTDLVTAVSIRTEIDSNSTQLAAIVADTDELQTDDIPSLIAALPTAVENRQEMDSNSTQLTAIVADTDELQTDDVPSLIGALNDLATTDLDTALTAIHLDHLLAADYDPASKPGVATALLNELIENDGGLSRFTENSLEQAPSGTGASAATIADAVWEELIADHSGTSGSTAEALDAAGGGSTPAAIADAVLDELLSGHTDAGSLGKAVADIETDVTAVLADTDELQTDDVPGLIAALNDPTAVAIRTEIDSNSTQLTAIVADTDELQTDDVPGLIGALNNVSTAEVNAQVDSALTDIHLDHLLAANYDPASKPGVATALLNELIENDGGLSRFTENSLEQAPSGTGASAATIADAVLDEALSGHTSAGSLGKAVADVETDVTAVLADTNELQVDDVPGLIGALNDPTAAAVADQVWEETLSDHSGTSGSTAEALSNIPGASKGAIEYTYTIDDGTNPIDGAEVWITTDSGGNNVIWSGVSDALGIARASDDEKPWLDAGTYYGWAQKAGYSFSNPDTLAVS